MRTRTERVHGPYQHGDRWRVVLVGADGRRRYRSFATEAEAASYVPVVRSQAEGRTVRSSVDGHLAAMRNRGLRSSTIERANDHLCRILQLDRIGHKPVRFVTAAKAEELYDQTQAGAAVDTHRNALSAAKAWGKWCKRQGWLPANPFAEVEGQGRRRRGKEQPRIDEGRILLDACLDRAEQRDEGAVATMAAMLLGPRATETVTREVRDLDDAGHQLWIPETKTEAGRRRLEVPDVLRPHLIRLTVGKSPTAPIFARSDGSPQTRHWLYRQVHRLCDLAGIQRVCPQALRGFHGTAGIAGGKTSHEVAAQLGHGNTKLVEDGTYGDRDVALSVRSRATLQVLTGGRGR
jgi:integrase